MAKKRVKAEKKTPGLNYNKGEFSRLFNTKKDRDKEIDIPPGPLSEGKALEVFDWLEGKKEFRHDYAGDLCYARAELMCHRLQEEGAKPYKAWAIPEQKGNELGSQFTGEPSLSVSIDEKYHFKGKRTTGWHYHVAVALDVKRRNGELDTMIFDPTTMDGPATQEEWADNMNFIEDGVVTTRYGQEGPNNVRAGYAPSSAKQLDRHPLTDAKMKISQIDESKRVEAKRHDTTMRREYIKALEEKAAYNQRLKMSGLRNKIH